MVFLSYLVKVPQEDASLEQAGPPREPEEPDVVVAIDSGEHIKCEADLLRLPDMSLQCLDSSESVSVILVATIHFGLLESISIFRGSMLFLFC